MIDDIGSFYHTKLLLQGTMCSSAESSMFHMDLITAGQGAAASVHTGSKQGLKKLNPVKSRQALQIGQNRLRLPQGADKLYDMLVESDTAHDRFNTVSAAAVSSDTTTQQQFSIGTDKDALEIQHRQL